MSAKVAITHMAVEAKINMFKLLSLSAFVRWERFRRQKVTDSSPPLSLPFELHT